MPVESLASLNALLDTTSFCNTYITRTCTATVGRLTLSSLNIVIRNGKFVMCMV